MKMSNCHPNRKSEARGLCKPCYDKWLKNNNPKYKQNQLSNTTKWKLANPEKMKIIQERRNLKIKSDPTYKLKRRNRTLIRNYGITLDDYEKMLKDQNGVCAICDRAPGNKPLHVDHCHRTGRVRGLLCHQCNWYLGTIEADPEIMVRIPIYLHYKDYTYFKNDISYKI